MPKETWVYVPGYEGLYEISSSGQVRVSSRDIKDCDGNFIRKLDPVIVKPKKDSVTGKFYVFLHDGEIYKKEIVDDLLNITFKQ